MIYCPKGHQFDEMKHASCPLCAEAKPVRQAPPTQFDEPAGPAAGGGAAFGGGFAVKPIPVFNGPGGFAGGGGFRPGPPQAAGAQRRPGGTVMDSDEEAIERLMGFLVITRSKHDDEHRYFRLSKGVNMIGTFGTRAAIEIRDQEISRQHALLVCTNTATRLVDLDSSNGTFVNDDRTEIASLKEGDEIRVGRTTLVFVPFDWVAEE
jgi:hypothetical protein